ncbi:MAG: glycosyltransferase family 1 protein [Sulfuriferula sp.]
MRALRLLHHIALTYLPVSFWRKRLTHVTHDTSHDTAEKQLLIDVSAIAKIDAKTGIQRVVRNLYKALLAAPPAGYRICPVAASRTQPYRYLPTDFLQQPATAPTLPIQVNAGDIFLGLDLSAHLIPHHLEQLWNWKLQGTRISIVIYDLLPVLHPEWFTPRASRNFHRWLRAIALLADNTIAISRTVQADFHDWMQKHYQLSTTEIPCATIPLGAELDNNASITPLPRHLAEHDFILMVGTIEPRKGYDDALDAFESLWATGDSTRLIIVGKQGWDIEELSHRLRTHAETGKRLIWLNDVEDNLLSALYRQCLGVLITSKGEGYGLPLIEAAYFRKPVLARDLSVFREIASKNVSFFHSASDHDLTTLLPQWLKRFKSENKYIQQPTELTWQVSCLALTQALCYPSPSVGVAPQKIPNL